jgi:hypothetical protein
MTFEQARSFVRPLRLKSNNDYFLRARGDHANGKFPPDLPRSPQHVYRDNGWTNWNDFLGTSTKLTRDEEAWEEMFLRYIAYVEKHGLGQINWKDAGGKLSHWVNTQRQFQREGRLDPERKRRLDERGFDWDPKLDAWEVMFGELKRYQKRFGDCNVLQAWKENPKLGRWVSIQRRYEKLGKLSPARKARLDALGFSWGPQPNTRRPAAE